MEQVHHAFAERVLRDMYDAVLVLDANGNISYVNGPAARMLELDEGYREKGSHFSLLAANPYNKRFTEAIFSAMASSGASGESTHSQSSCSSV